MAGEKGNSQQQQQAGSTGTAIAQLPQLPKDELKNLAEQYGLEPASYKTHQQLLSAINDRRQMIAAMDREAMLDVVKWGRRPVAVNATREALAQEIARIQSMRFDGLSHRGLIVLARLRGIRVDDNEPAKGLLKKLRKQEGFFARLGRKQRALVGSFISGLLGDEHDSDAYKFLPPQPGQGAPAGGNPTRPGSIREEIEEAGLIGGLAGRIRREADSYLNQKLDEIEARIDRKLEDIDRRLAEWRDKEVANRIRILKITLWASVIVALISLAYSYVKVYFWPHPSASQPQPTQLVAPATPTPPPNGK